MGFLHCGDSPFGRRMSDSALCLGVRRGIRMKERNKVGNVRMEMGRRGDEETEWGPLNLLPKWINYKMGAGGPGGTVRKSRWGAGAH